MKPAIATVCLSGGLQEKLEAIASAGFRHVEIFENDLIAFPGKPADVRWLCADLGLSIVTVQSFRDFEGLPEPRRSRTFDRAERKFDLLQELGTDLLFVCSSVSPEARAESIERMRASGVAMLAVHDNYCDDLEARADLPPGLLHRLRTLDILYDRDRHGPFLQAYTATLEGGFFFEIVQRDGYTGYGAANAAIRLAAQAWAARSLEMPRT